MIGEENWWRCDWCRKNNLDMHNDIHWHISKLAYHDYLNKQKEIDERIEYFINQVENETEDNTNITIIVIGDIIL